MPKKPTTVRLSIGLAPTTKRWLARYRGGDGAAITAILQAFHANGDSPSHAATRGGAPPRASRREAEAAAKEWLRGIVEATHILWLVRVIGVRKVQDPPPPPFDLAQYARTIEERWPDILKRRPLKAELVTAAREVARASKAAR